MGFSPRLVDVHEHAFLFNPDKALSEYEEAREEGIGVLLTSIDLTSAKRILQASLPENVAYVLGIYPPGELERDREAGFITAFNARPDLLPGIIREAGERLVGIGEIGLDGTHSVTQEDIRVFKEQLRIARRESLPVVVHSRRAEREVISILQEEAPSMPVILHSFTGRQRLIPEALETLNVYVSIPCNVLRSEQMQQLARLTPADRLLLETDAPFLGAERGIPSRSTCLPRSLARIAMLKDIPIAVLKEQLLENTYRVFPRLKEWYARGARSA